MKEKYFISFIFLISLNLLQAAYINKNDVWKYYDYGMLSEKIWTQSTFNDSLWQSDKGPFGNGGKAATMINPNITTYFRKIFEISSTKNINALYFNILLQGGAVIYLNGEEILRINMPRGKTRFCMLPIPADPKIKQSRYLDYIIEADFSLKEGKNIIAVEVHRDSSNMENGCFDLKLSGVLLNDPPPGIKKLDKLCAFSFSIMSDNKGAGLENIHMYKCDRWIKEAGDRFILGLGDHVKDNRPNHFLTLLKTDSLWHNHFYPNVADGENEYWGKGQGDWGAGGPIFDYVNLAERKNVVIRSDSCEYYAVENHNGITVHIIQLHYSDTPKNPQIAFNESSRQYLMNTLDKINKTDNDIIVVLAHTGAWVNQLNTARRRKLINKADLILGATTHHYQRYIFKDADPDSGAIAFNTGAVGNSAINGFLQVHVLKNPTRFVIQYQQTAKSSRKLQKKGYAFLKYINGRIFSADWNKILNLK